jgi:hypothetical protein
MKRTLIGLAAASILAVPLAAAAHDGDRYRGAPGYGPPGHYYKPKHAKRYYAPPAAVVYRPAPPRVVGYPVYVPAPVVRPAPIVVAPAPVVVAPPPGPWPLRQIDIGFRIFF